MWEKVPTFQNKKTLNFDGFWLAVPHCTTLEWSVKRCIYSSRNRKNCDCFTLQHIENTIKANRWILKTGWYLHMVWMNHGHYIQCGWFIWTNYWPVVQIEDWLCIDVHDNNICIYILVYILHSVWFTFHTAPQTSWIIHVDIGNAVANQMEMEMCAFLKDTSFSTWIVLRFHPTPSGNTRPWPLKLNSTVAANASCEGCRW